MAKARSGSDMMLYSRATYAFFVVATAGALVFSVGRYSVATNLCALALGYVLAQLLWMFSHMWLHATFVEIDDYRSLGVGAFIGYLHHYEKVTALSDLWLVHRLSYFSNEGVYLFQFSLLSTAWLGYPAVLAFAYWSLWIHVIALAHEYYHLPRSRARTHFCAPVYLVLRLLERLHVIDRKRHRIHHGHHETDLQDVRHFEDLWVPRFVSRTFDHLWRLLLRLHVPGKRRLKVAYLVSFSVFSLALSMAVVAILRHLSAANVVAA